MRTIFWFRKDLRLTDNIGLTEALKDSSEVIPVFIIEPAWINSPITGSGMVAHLFANLRELSQQLQNLNSRLIIRFGEPSIELLKIARLVNAKNLYFNRNYEPLEVSRDEMVTSELKKTDLNVKSFKDLVIFEDEELVVNSSRGLVKLTRYKERWLKKLRDNPPVVHLLSEREKKKFIDYDWPVFTISDPKPKNFGHDYDNIIPPSGEINARKLLDSVDFNHKIATFPMKLADDPWNFVRWGNISIRELLSLIITKIGSDFSIQKIPIPIRELLEKIIEHDYYSILYFYTFELESSITESEWSQSYSKYLSWCNGSTGIPLIDAPMRQLNQTGWMPPSLRKLTADFLIRGLNINYSWGERFFLHKMLDTDPAQNSGFWKEIAFGVTPSIIFNWKIIQEKKIKKINLSSDYLCEFITVLNEVPEEFRFQPEQMPISLQKKTGCIIGNDYPEPILSRPVTVLKIKPIGSPFGVGDNENHQN